MRGEPPGWVLGHHAEDEPAEFHADTLSAGANLIPREPTPVHLESGTVPSHHGFPAGRESTPVSIRTSTAAISPRQPVKGANRGCGCPRFKTVSCCRNARFSKRRSRRAEKDWAARTSRSDRMRSMTPVLHGEKPEWHQNISI